MNAYQPIAAPRNQRSLEGLVAPLRQHVLKAVAILAVGDEANCDWIASASFNDIEEGDLISRSAWATVALLLVDMIRTGSAPDFDRAGGWFGIELGAYRRVEIAQTLSPLTGDQRLAQLLPYLLDTYGRTTRLDVIRDVSRISDRADRKKIGSFYTPADVAEFMVTSIADPDCIEGSWWLDPAVGSGVFLTAALRNYISKGGSEPEAFASSRLTGFDISPQACDFAAFAILSEVAHLTSRPLRTWCAIRSNLRALDSTRSSSATDLRRSVQPDDGPLRLICNPPYAASSTGKGVLASGRSTTSLYLPFVEMAWSIADKPQDAAALVVPLALGANRSGDHRRCRSDMMAAGGSWTLLFFDRQPHALFGEEAKTRATIAIKRPGPTPAEISTSRLLKWTSRQRQAIFREDRAVNIGKSSIGRLVPKLGSNAEAALYRLLDQHRLRIASRPEPSRAEACQIVGASLSSDVFVGGTAYNFLNVFRNYPSRIPVGSVLSTSGIHRLRCEDQDEADLITAILVSRVTFWLWHVECDGFHVPAWFLTELPLLNMRISSSDRLELQRLGRDAWRGLQEDQICSSNKEKSTLAFRPTMIGDIKSNIDQIILRTVGSSVSEVQMLLDFERDVVSIDGSIRRSNNSVNQEIK